MTFEEAVEMVNDYGADYGIKRGLLLDSLELIRDEMEKEDALISYKYVMAYNIVCREMRKLFV